jgi:hypothetical protein
MIRSEQGVVTRVRPKDILVEDDFGDYVYVSRAHVVGTPRVGATCTLVRRTSESHSFRAFIEPPEEKYPTTYERCDWPDSCRSGEDLVKRESLVAVASLTGDEP